MSKRYEMVKLYYLKGQWNETMVRNAVKCGWITEEECEEILNAR